MAKNWDNAHILATDNIAERIRLLYEAAANQIVAASASIAVPDGGDFFFADFPVVNKKVNKILARLASRSIEVLNAATEAAWLLSADKNLALIQEVVPGLPVDSKLIERVVGRNVQGLKAFQKRKQKGLDLSTRVWNTAAKDQIELTIDLGLASGESAAVIASNAKKYLNDPDKLFRRVRDEKGVLRLSKSAKAFNPGAGVYRSSTKNAQRMARTEVNMAYREADHAAWGDMDFVVGYEVQRSNRIYYCVQCESLKGKYPKTFKFVGWHPQCRCRCIPILASKDEIDLMVAKILDDEDTSDFKSQYEVKAVPKGYAAYIKDNQPQLLRAKSVPYFIRDNYKNGDLSKGLSI